MGPSDSLVPVDLGSGFPCRGLPRGGRLVLCGAALLLGPATARAPSASARRVRGLVTGSPFRRSLSWRDEGLPGYWAVLFARAVVIDPAGCAARLAHSRRAAPWPSGWCKPWAPGIQYLFVATYRRPTRSRAYASTSPLPGSLQGSLPTWLGSALVGRDSHPLDDASEFHGLIARSFLTSRAWSQRTIDTRGRRVSALYYFSSPHRPVTRRGPHLPCGSPVLSTLSTVRPRIRVNGHQKLTHLGHQKLTHPPGSRRRFSRGKGRRLLVRVFSFEGVANAVTGTAGHEDVGVLGEAIEEGGGELVVAEDAVPLAEGEVGRDDGGGALVTGGEDVEEQFAAGLLEGDEAELVEQQEGCAAKAVLKAREQSGVARFGERADEVRGAVEEDVVAALDGLDAERGGQVGLAGADGADQHDVARGIDPGAAGELLDASALESVGASPVELRERLSCRESRGAQPTLDRMLGAHRDLGVEHGAKEAERMLSVGERLARELVALAPDRRKLEHAGVRPDGSKHDIHFVCVAHAEHLAASSSAS